MIRVKSFVHIEGVFQSVEIEVISQKGLPSLQFVGLPDQVIKESAIRIKSAIRSSGYEWPQAKQIIVNLKPSHLKKTSRGLEFAVATAILLETHQLVAEDTGVTDVIKDAEVTKISNVTKNSDITKSLDVTGSTFDLNTNNIAFYGELDLEGNVFLPEDFKIYNGQNNERLFTGKTPDEFWCSQYYFQINSLKDLNTPNKVHPKKLPWQVARPKDFDSVYLTARQKELIQICVLGEHHLLMLGPAGSGKSLLADVIHSLRKPPSKFEQECLYADLLNQSTNEEQTASNLQYADTTNPETRVCDELQQMWRPLIKPHHSITLQGLIGGGIALNEGELSRANFGTLVFDELLEYKPQVVEALREPLETGKARVARSSGVATFESRFLWVATSNLCPCGDYVPGKSVNCRYSLNRCRSYGQKLSGPLVDRFDLISFSNEWKGDRAYAVEQISDELNELWENGEVVVDTENLPFVVRRLLANWDGSYRRKKATLRVACTIARLNKRNYLIEADVEKALSYTVRPFASLQRWD